MHWCDYHYAMVVHALGYANSELSIFSSQCHKVTSQPFSNASEHEPQSSLLPSQAGTSARSSPAEATARRAACEGSLKRPVWPVRAAPERIASVSEHASMHAHECSHEAAHVGDCSPYSCTGVAIEQLIDSFGSARSCRCIGGPVVRSMRGMRSVCVRGT